MGGEAPELEENKKPRHHVEAFEVFECFSSCVFYVVMIYSFLKINFLFWVQI